MSNLRLQFLLRFMLGAADFILSDEVAESSRMLS